MEEKEYLADCQKQTGRNDNGEVYPWQDSGTLNQARAFASSITFEIEFNNTILYILGGYHNDSGKWFLNSLRFGVFFDSVNGSLLN